MYVMVFWKIEAKVRSAVHYLISKFFTLIAGFYDKSNPRMFKIKLTNARWRQRINTVYPFVTKIETKIKVSQYDVSLKQTAEPEAAAPFTLF